MDTVESADGTKIAYDRVGDGPPLVVSVGAFCTRHTFVPPADLAARFTVYTYDRRGRGDSGDTPPFAPQREYEDLAAVASVAGEAPFAFGHSSGAAIVLRAAARGLPLRALAAYEAPFANDDTPRPSVDPAPHIRSLVAAGRRAEAAEFWMSEVVRIPPEVVSGLKAEPWFTAMEPLTATLPYDIEVTDGGVPTAELASITVPSLVLGGANSPAWFRRSVAEQAAAIPGGRLRVVDGYDHNIPPDVLAPVLLGFFN